MLIDTHCHLLSTEYDDVNEIIKHTFTSGIDKIIINGFDVESSKEAVKLANEYKNVYAAVGIGPENVTDITDEMINTINNLSNNKKVVAIGEIGLDYYWTIDNKTKQNYVFEKMLEIANQKKLPIIVHSRKSINDVYNKVKKYNIKGIMHCFSSSLEMANEFIKLGFLIGIGGVVTFKNSKEIKKIVEKIELKNISLETDSPYLSPEPKRGTINVPFNLIYIVNKIAEIKGVNTNNVVEETTNAVMSIIDFNC